MEKMTPERVSIEYAAGLRFNTGIDVYETVQNNENFFIGKQWEGVKSNGLPTPVFNFLKRVVLFCVANVSTDNLKLHAKPMANPVGIPTNVLEVFSNIINGQFDALFEINNVGGLIREFCRNAAVDGDGCLYAYWDNDMETGQAQRGNIRVESLMNTQVMFGNPNCRDVQSQPYILIERRMLVSEAKDYAKEHGSQNYGNITADSKQAGNVEMDELGGEKVTVLLRLWRDKETGHIFAYETTSNVEIRKPWDLGINI